MKWPENVGVVDGFRILKALDKGLANPQAGNRFAKKLEQGDMGSQVTRFVREGGYSKKSKAPGTTTPACPDFQAASDILGVDHVITPEQYAETYRVPAVTPLIRYTEAELVEAAESNRRGETDFRLIASQGLSILRQREILGTNSQNQPCFKADVTWFLEERQAYWTKQALSSQVIMIDMKGRYPSTSWFGQEREIMKSGPYVRAHEIIVLEAITCLQRIHDQKHLTNFWHWGCSPDADGYMVSVSLSEDGLHVSYIFDPDWYAHVYLVACRSRKFTL